MGQPAPILLIACGALAREIVWLIDQNGWDHMEVTCLPAKIHNTPDRIPGDMRKKIHAAKASGKYSRILALFADCGTGGLLDVVLKEENVERIAGPHCYAFYTGLDKFETMHGDEIGTFYLTDYLVKHFDLLIIKGLGLDRFPQLRDDYFGHYTRLIYLAQTDDPELCAQAHIAAEKLGLPCFIEKTGMGDLANFLEKQES